MTEAEWLVCTEPIDMVWHVLEGASDRKLRLFACAYCRSRWPNLDGRANKILSIGELQADGLASTIAIREAQAQAREHPRVDRLVAVVVSTDLSRMLRGICIHDFPSGDAQKIKGKVVRLFRDLFGNPFRPISI